MRRVPRVEELTEPPVIGKYYDVPAVLVPPGMQMVEGWVPVIGPAHTDREILNFDVIHVHFDLRFACAGYGRFEEHGAVGPDDLAAPLCLSHRRYDIAREHVMFASPVTWGRRIMKCKRAFPSWRASRAGEMPHEVMREAMPHACLKACKVCPHRGLPLASIPVIDGEIECPGHGLRFTASTGLVAPTKTVTR